MSSKHPIQPLINKDGVIRFKENKIVRYLLDFGGIDMNMIAKMDFSQEDREQFAQLIGYSLGGATDLSYVSTEVLEIAERKYKNGETEVEARINYLEKILSTLRNRLADDLADFFECHPDDLKKM